MKNIIKHIGLLCLVLTLTFLINPVLAKTGFSQNQKGYFFGKTTMPFEIVEVSNKEIPLGRLLFLSEGEKQKITMLDNLKRGESKRVNLMKIFEWGDAGIMAACNDGQIRKIHFIEVKKDKISIPFLPFLPLYLNTYATVVYGE